MIDFTVEKNGDIWVLVDGQWSDTENYSPASELVKLVRWSGNEVCDTIIFILEYKLTIVYPIVNRCR